MINIKHVDSKKGGPVGQFSLPGSKLNLPIDTIFPWSLHTSLASRALRSRFARAPGRLRPNGPRLPRLPRLPRHRATGPGPLWNWDCGMKMGCLPSSGGFEEKKDVTNVLPET